MAETANTVTPYSLVSIASAAKNSDIYKYKLVGVQYGLPLPLPLLLLSSLYLQNLIYDMRDKRKSKAAPASARPTILAIDSVWMGWEANNKLLIKVIRFCSLNNCAANFIKRRLTKVCSITLNAWNPSGESPWSIKFSLNDTTVRGRYEPWVLLDRSGVPQKSFTNMLYHGVLDNKSWFVLMARLKREIQPIMDYFAQLKSN